MEKEKTPKLSIELKQTQKGAWYVDSFKANADTLKELNTLLDSSLSNLNEKLKQLTVPKTELNAGEEHLFNKLRGVRMKLAKKENCAPYIIFHDSILKQFVKHKPKTTQDLIKIEGVGEKKIEKYGEIFLESIKNFSEPAA